MKRLLNVAKLVFLFIFINLFTAVFSFAMENPKIEQFTIKDAEGNTFCVNTDISSVFEALGEPISRKNLWEEYPNASCAFYNLVYDGIEFNYYDINNKIVSMKITGNKYTILDNGLSVGSLYKDVLKKIGEPDGKSTYTEPSGERVKFLSYSTMGSENPELYIVKKNVSSDYYEISFRFDEKTKKCISIIVFFVYG